METSIVSELANILVVRGIGNLGNDVLIGQMPPSPDNMVMLMAGGGDVPDMYIDTRYATIDIWTRNRHSDAGYDMLQNVFSILQRMQNVQLNRYYLYFLHATTDILDMDKDSQERKLYKITFRAIYRDTNVVS